MYKEEGLTITVIGVQFTMATKDVLGFIILLSM